MRVSVVMEAGASFHMSMSRSGIVSKSVDPAKQEMSKISATAPTELLSE